MTAAEPERPLLDVLRLGLVPYAEAHERQRELVERRLAGEARDTLVLCEHPPVITLGRGTPADSVQGTDVPVVSVERGGEATYHGPGQLVVYPILALSGDRRDLHRYLRDLEEVVIRCLAEVGVVGTRRPGLTGVWVGERKICSLGVAVRRWVTWHGFALNVHTDLSAFQGFRPCGLESDVMTRVADHADVPPSTMLFQVLAVKHVCDVFERELPPIPPPTSEPDGPGGSLPIHPSSS